MQIRVVDQCERPLGAGRILCLDGAYQHPRCSACRMGVRLESPGRVEGQLDCVIVRIRRAGTPINTSAAATPLDTATTSAGIRYKKGINSRLTNGRASGS